MEDKALTPIWITRWALTGGIIAADAEFRNNGSMAVYRVGDGPRTMVHTGDFHLTEEAAIQHAYIMRAKKLLSLQKQIDKLQKLSFMKKE